MFVYYLCMFPQIDVIGEMLIMHKDVYISKHMVYLPVHTHVGVLCMLLRGGILLLVVKETRERDLLTHMDIT